MNKLVLPLLAAAAVTSGCSVLSPEPNVYIKPEPTYAQAKANPFVASSKDAIQALVSSLDVKSMASKPLLVATVVNVNDLRKTAPLGRTLSEQYASHLVAQGFTVKELKLRGDIFVREETGELMLSRELKDIAKTHAAALVVVGTYSAAENTTFVSLKLVQTEDGKILRGHDYALPNDADVKKLLAIK